MKKCWEITNQNIIPQTRAIINEYLFHLSISYHSEVTITIYKRSLEQFFAECSIPLKDLTTSYVSNKLQNYSVGKSPSTVNLFVSCLSSFFRYCIEEREIEEMLIKTGWRLKIPKSTSSALTKQEYDRVKLASESFSIQDQALVILLFSSGFRSKEASNLNIQDIDLEQKTVSMSGSKKYRPAITTTVNRLQSHCKKNRKKSRYSFALFYL